MQRSARHALSIACVAATAVAAGAGPSSSATGRCALPGRIAFSAGPLEPGKLDVYTLNPDGTDLRRITHGQGMSFDPTWSPDGCRIAFRSVRDDEEEIRVVNSDGSGEQNLTHRRGMDYAPEWSPDGKKIAFASDRSGLPHIWIMGADGSRPHLLTSRLSGEYPAWSPDGRRIAWAVNQGSSSADFEVYVAEVSGGRVRRLTRNHAWDMAPVWSPNERRILFASERGRSGHAQDLYTMRPDGTHVRLVARNTGGSGAWSPDGKRIVYGSLSGLVISRFDGTARTVLRTGLQEPSFPDWAPARR